MAKYSNQVIYDIKTTLDASGVTKLRSELSKLNQDVATIGKTQWGLKDSEIQRTINQVNRLQKAITECFNPKIGMLDLSKLNKTLEQEKALLGTINTDWAKMGAQGTRAINSLAASVLTLNKDAITINSTLSKIANTFGNTVRWGITASIFQEMMSSVQGAVSYMKNLDESLTQIQMVTNSSKENMRELAQYANNAAQALGSTTVDYTNAVKVFVQEGFSESESKQYANLSTKLANVSEQNTQTTSDQITAYRNAFQLDYQQTVEAMDKVANVANNTASNVNELMTASQRSASVANAVNASQDSFLASIATIESVTRQSAEEIGNGLKTIYQRMADIKVSGKTDDGVDYGQYATTLKEVGVDILDANREIKSFDQILTELQAVWGDLSDTMKQAVGQKVAGKFQYNRFVALMDNPEYYQKAYDATQGASGMMDQMNDYYVESIEGRLNTLQTAGEQIISTLFDQDNIEPIIGAATDFLNIINKIIDSVGGGLPVFTALSGILLRTFNAQIGEQTARIATNIQASMQISRNANFVEPVLGKIQGLQEARGEDTSAIGEIRETLQGKGYANLTDDTRKKVKDSALELLKAENKVKDIKNSQKLLQDEITDNILNSGEAADALLSKEKALFEEKQKIVEEDEAWLNHAIEIGDISDDEIIAREQELEISRKERDVAEKRYEQTKVAVNVEGDFNKLTLEQAKALDSVNSKLNNKTNYAQRYLEVTRETEEAQGELNAASDKMKGLGEQITMERQAASITNLVSGLTSAVFLTQSLVSLWQLWGDENTSQEDKIIGTISSLVMILPMAITAWQAFTAVEWQAVKASLAFIATPVGAAIAAIAAVIGIAVIAFNGWQESIHAASKEFEAQKELLSKTKKNYSDAREEVDALKQSIDSLGETKKSLEDLTEGTDKWKEAVRKLNDQVLTLLQTYPELAQYVENEDGVLNINDVGMDQFYQQQLNEADHLASINSVQQINTLQAQNKKEVEDFSNQWGLSKEEISSAIEEGAYSLEGKSDLLNASFAELVNKIQINSTSIDNLSDNIGTLNTTYSDYSSKEDINLDEVKEAIRKQYGVSQYDEYGNSTGTKLDFSTMTNDKEFLDAVIEATGKNIIGATDTSWFDSNVKFKTNDGDEFEYTTDQLLNLLADSQAAIDATNKKLEENRIIYEAFGARYDESSKKFVDSSGETVSSLEDLNGVTSDEIAAIKAFQDGIYNDIAVKDFYGSLEEFVTELKESTLSVDGFSEALLAAQVQRKEEGVFGDEGRLTSLSQTQGMMVDANADGLTENLKLSPEQAKAVMTDMMKKLNESSLSDDEKLQLMDKIDWNMPVQDILANIQHAIDTGNINSAFVDITGLEDDSERKSKVLEDYDISESTLDAYTEQLQTTGELAEQHEKLADSLEYAKEQFGEESDEAKDARKALSAFNDESEDIAVDLAQTQKGLEALSDGMSKYGDILKNGDKTTLEYAEALGTVKKALADTLNVSEESISNSLIESHLQDIEALAAGDEEALNNLRIAAGQDIVLGFYMSGDSTLTREHMEYLQQKAIELNSLDIEVAANLDDQAFIDSLDEMLWNGELTRDQVNEYLRGIGYEPEFHTEKKQVTLFETPGFQLPVSIGGISMPMIDIGQMSIPGYVEVPQLGDSHSSSSSSSPSSGSPLRRTASPTAPSGQTGISPSYVNDAYKPDSNNNSNKNKEKQPKNNKPKDYQNSEWDYLTDITNDLDRAEAVMERLSKLEDRLYGASRVSQLKKISNEYKKYIALLDKEVKLAQKHAKTLREKATDENGNLTINGYANQAGFDRVEFDAKGNIQNGKAIEEALLKQLNQATTNYNNHRNDEDTSKYEAALSLAQKNYDGFMKALSEYEATLGTIEDGQNAIQDYKEKIQDAADAVVDSIQEGIDNVVEAIDSQREFMKTYRDWQQGGSGYSHFENDRKYYSEGLEGIFSPTKGSNGASVFDEQLTNLQNRYKDAKKVFDGNSNNADDEALSEVDAQNNLREATDSLTKTLNSAIGYYDSLMDTIDKASKKMDDLIDSRLEEFDDINSYLDSKLEQSQLLFGDRPENNSQFYQQKIATNMEKMVSINTAIEAKQATVDSLESLEASGKELSTEERQTLTDARKELAKLQKEQTDTETDLLTDIRNKLTADITKELREAVKKMFNGGDPEWISQQWEVAARMDSQFLDDYNRAFEIEKLELKYQEALNDARKFSLSIQEEISERMEEELNWLRTKLNVSKYDVEYAEKNLEILQKRIALEEARENKTQMRLQRNVAGNYDFVYTADEDAINEAKENLLRAQQEAYNLSNQMWRDTYESAIKAARDAENTILAVAADTTVGLEERQERVKWLLDNLGEYISNSKVELNEVSINLYNDIVGAEQLIAEENLGNLADLFEQMRNDSIQTKISAQKDAEEMKESVKNSISGEGGMTSSLATAWENVRNSGDEAWGGLAEDIGGEEGYLKKIWNASDNTWKGIGATGKTTWHNLKDAVTGKDGILTGITTGSVDSWKKVGEAGVASVKAIKEGTKEPLKRIKLGSEETTGKINKDVEGLVGQLGTQFQLGTTYAISSTTEVQQAVTGAYSGITQSMVEYEEANRSAVGAAGESLDTFVTDSVDTAAERLGNLNETENQFKEDLEYLNNTINESAVEMANWKSQIDAAMSSSQSLITSSNSLLMSIGNDGIQLAIAAGTAEAFTGASDELKSSLDDLADAADDVSSSIKTMASDISSTYVNLARAAKTAQSAYKNMETAANYAKSAADSADRAAQRANNSINTLNRNSSGDQIDLSWVSKLKENVQSGVSSLLDKFRFNTPMYTNIWQVGDTFTPGWYDTGGYTGKWSDGDTDTKNGKWAILHQKELVLNATDTENILSAVDIVRDIMSGINNISSYKKNIFEQQNSSNDIKQKVEISATFPGVTEAIEIKQALEQLANNAYQAANRR